MILARFIIDNPTIVGFRISSNGKTVLRTASAELFGFIVAVPKIGTNKRIQGFKEEMIVESVNKNNLYRIDIHISYQL